MSVIYIGRTQKQQNISGLVQIDEENLTAWLMLELGLTLNEPRLALAKQEISNELRSFGVCGLWSSKGTVVFLSEETMSVTVVLKE